MANNLDKLLKLQSYELSKIARKSALWFEQQAFELVDHANLDEAKLIKGNSRLNTSMDITPGNMYFYAYDAKTKEKLPYYDMFPLCLPFAETNDGFIGLNLHYLPYDYRVKLLSKLTEFQSSPTLNDKTKLQFSWATIAGVAKYKAAKPCVKRYLYSHVRSRFKRVEPQDWATAAMLPLEKFTGSDKFTVWADSLGK